MKKQASQHQIIPNYTARLCDSVLWGLKIFWKEALVTSVDRNAVGRLP